ncbi:MAG: DUF2442 domain-containing protein [bacterium]
MHVHVVSEDGEANFKNQTINDIQNIQLLHGVNLYWPTLDIDLEIDNLENPEKYPLKSKIIKKIT